MSELKNFPFDKNKFSLIKEYRFGNNWPVVYIIKDDKEAYIGETTSLFNRTKQHYNDKRLERRNLKEIYVISDEEYNKSATLDIESWLIQYFAADGKFKLQNGNEGLKNHNYYDKEKYEAKFEQIWKQLQEQSLVEKDLFDIKNSDLFKYSPYKTLSEDQSIFVEELLHDIVGKILKEKEISGTLHKHFSNDILMLFDDLINKAPTEVGRLSYIVSGAPGTGKTILATYLMKILKDKKETRNLNIALVVPVSSLRKTLKKVFKEINGLKSTMIIGPSDVTKQEYDILIVDEAHRLKQRKNITNYKSFDDTNKKFGFDKNKTELDWILATSPITIFFYDKNQSIRPSDVSSEHFEKMYNLKHYDLSTQLRVKAGEDYIKFIESVFEVKQPYIFELDKTKYDLKLYENFELMIKDIKLQNEKVGLSRVVAGYAWEWKSKNKDVHDIEIQNIKLKWNSEAQDWINSKNSINEVGCIHTVQGYDLNYVGVIIGPDISFDFNLNQIIIKKENYFDTNGYKGIKDPYELKRYIINIYKTLLTRGIKGCYIYIVDDDFRKYFKKHLSYLF